MVISTTEILEDSNALLKGLNIEEIKTEKEQSPIQSLPYPVNSNSYSRPKSSNPNHFQETKDKKLGHEYDT